MIKTFKLVFILGVLLMTGCISTQFDWEKDFRKNSVYLNTEIQFDSAKTEAKGTILLIHGTAPMMLNGAIAVPEVQQSIQMKMPNFYSIQPLYENLAMKLNELGWNTLRYTRLGVKGLNFDNGEYAKTDFANIMTQLKGLWEMMPEGLPKIIFAWSGGSIHATHMPLDEADALVLLGSIATKRVDLVKQMAKSSEEMKQVDQALEKFRAEKNSKARTDMFSKDMSFGRFWDEDELADNWTYLKPYPELATLILHGDADKESGIKQGKTWQEKLPRHNITTIIKPKANHAWGFEEKPDMEDLAVTMDKWLTEKLTEK